MNPEYFFSPPSLVSQDTLLIEGDEFAHLTHVMRKHVNDTIRVVDGQGTVYDAVITEIRARSARCAITARHRLIREPGREVILAVGMLKNFARFDFIVEKATELGVRSIHPLLTERTIPHHARTERWQKLALAAMKQSERCVLPGIFPASRFSDFIRSQAPTALKLIADEQVTSPSIPEVVRSAGTQTVVVCIGPEGGFSNGETSEAVKGGFTMVSLGPRRLRTETAAIVAIAYVLS